MTLKQKNYQVVRRQFVEDLESTVNALLLKGWVPAGGVYRETLGSYYCQAMWRRHAPPIQGQVVG